MAKVFISHSRQDREFVEREIITLLRDHGIETWYSADDIQTAESWERSILAALKACDYFLLVMSPQSAQSEWVRREVHWAFERGRKTIIPVLKENCDFDEFHIGMVALQYVDFQNANEQARAKLLAAFNVSVNKPPETPRAAFEVEPKKPPELLRKMLLRDMRNGSLRKSYLAERTAALLLADEKRAERMTRLFTSIIVIVMFPIVGTGMALLFLAIMFVKAGGKLSGDLTWFPPLAIGLITLAVILGIVKQLMGKLTSSDEAHISEFTKMGPLPYTEYMAFWRSPEELRRQYPAE
jgi:TIR domain